MLHRGLGFSVASEFDFSGFDKRQPTYKISRAGTMLKANNSNNHSEVEFGGNPGGPSDMVHVDPNNATAKLDQINPRRIFMLGTAKDLAQALRSNSWPLRSAPRLDDPTRRVASGAPLRSRNSPACDPSS